MNQKNSLDSIFSPAALWSALAGGGGGLLAYILGEFYTRQDPSSALDFWSLLLGSASWSALNGLGIGIVLLIQDNMAGMRGRWYRDWWLAIPAFLALGFIGGLAGQAVYSVLPISLLRGIGWALMGLMIGASLGAVRLDWVQCWRGALGGALGGFAGGSIFDALTMAYSKFNPGDNGSFARAVGLIITGTLIGLLIRLVQDALRSAWIMGISTGPYEGKQFTLSNQRVSVGAAANCQMVLDRLSNLPPRLGEFVFQQDAWWWIGEVIQVNGVPQLNVALRSGDNLKIGGTQFRFNDKNASPKTVPAMPPNTFAGPPPPTSPSGAFPSGPPPTVAWGSPPPPPPTVPLPPPAPSPPVNVPPHAVLLAANGSLLRAFSGSGSATLGRVAGNDIVLNNEAISSRHAQFTWSAGSVTVVDLGSTNGSFVNGQRLAANAPTVLKPGDKLKLGPLEFTLQLAN